jgi:hypothetical protein
VGFLFNLTVERTIKWAETEEAAANRLKIERVGSCCWSRSRNARFLFDVKEEIERGLGGGMVVLGRSGSDLNRSQLSLKKPTGLARSILVEPAVTRLGGEKVLLIESTSAN